MQIEKVKHEDKQSTQQYKIDKIRCIKLSVAKNHGQT